MADVTSERNGYLLRNLMRILATEPEGLSARDALARLEQTVDLTPHEAGEYDGGGRRFDKIVRFVTVPAVKAGWLIKDRGHWSVTEDGLAAMRQVSDDGDFCREVVRLYRQWKSAQPTAPNAEETPEERDVLPGSAYEDAVDAAHRDVTRFLEAMPPYEFQKLVAGLLEGMGYHVEWIAPPGRDGGLDILAFPDPLGTKPPRIKVQVKRHQTKVPVDGVRSFMGVLGEGDVGIFVNTGGFTKDAEDAARHWKNRMTLISMDKLLELWIEHYDALDDETRRRMPMQPVYFLAPEE